jgi:hypothetical protein
VLSLHLETPLNNQEILDVLEDLHLLEEIAFAGLFVDKVGVEFAQDRIVCSFKVVFVNLYVKFLQLPLYILPLRIHNVVAEVKQLLKHMDEFVVFVRKQVFDVVEQTVDGLCSFGIAPLQLS